MRHIKSAFLGLLAALFLLNASLALADDLVVHKAMPDGTIGYEYSARINVTGGTAPYKFTLIKGNLPNGLVMTEDGLITTDPDAHGWVNPKTQGVGGGYLKAGGYFPGHYVKVEDADGNTAFGFVAVRIIFESIAFKVTDYEYAWDGEAHKAALSPAKPLVEGEDYTVTYDNVSTAAKEEYTEVSDAGTYMINITQLMTMYRKGYLLGNIDHRQLIIERNRSNTLNMRSLTVDYGEPYDMEVNITPAEIAEDYSLRFEGTNGTVYPASAQKPQNAGSYLVTATATNPNYRAAVARQTLRINPLPITFAVEDCEQQYEAGKSPFAPTVTALDADKDGNPYTAYKIVYTKADGTEIDKVSFPGEYTYRIVSTDGNYVPVGDNITGSFTLTSESLVFLAEDNRLVYDGQPHKAKINAADLVEGEDFFVAYDNAATEEVENLSEVTEAGTYNIIVTLPEESPVQFGGVEPSKFIISPKPLNFTCDGAAEVFYTAADQTPELLPEDENVTADDYEISYTWGDEPAAALINAGEYALHITVNNGNYVLGDLPFEQFVIKKAPLDFAAAEQDITYDGQAHTLDFSPAAGQLLGEDTLPAGAYTVRYIKGEQSLEAMTDAGDYTVAIELDHPNYQAGSVQPAGVSVKQAEVSFTVSDTEQIYSADKEAYAPTVEPSVEGFADYTITYTKGGVTQEAVTGAGEYVYQIRLTNDNYRAVGELSGAFTVTTTGVYFTVSDNEYVYDGQPHKATLTADGLTEGEDYSVVYGRAGAGATNAGSYTIIVTMLNPNYQLGGLSDNKLTIIKRPVDFVITDTEFMHYTEDETHQATVKAEGFTEGEDFTVTYDNAATGIVEAHTAVSEIGRYNIVITMLDAANNEVGKITGDTVLNITEPAAVLRLAPGNSIAAKMTEEELAAFAEDHTYDGVYYSPKAWVGENADLAPTAYFVIGGREISRFDYNRPGYTALDISGAPGEVSITIDGEAAAEWQPAPGVYTMAYTMADGEETLTAERLLVVIGSGFADINRDNNVNMGDARYLENQVLPNIDAMTEQADLLYLYRTCDTNHDGEVNAEDAAAILNRMNEALIPYYGTR